jgi:3-oxoacyl-(acyl-carrier-protein) synthase
MTKKEIYINSTSSLSALGSSDVEVWENMIAAQPKFPYFKDTRIPVSALSVVQNESLYNIAKTNKNYNHLDKTALMAIAVGRALAKKSTFRTELIGVNIGSSRGATESFEMAFENYFSNKGLPFATSPTTTLGNIATNLAQDLGLQGPAISHSITCSSALHALLNAYAFLKSGMLSDFIIGGAEAPLTGFSIEQMRVLKLYSKRKDNFPCRSLDFLKTGNTLVLGEAASLAHLSTVPSKDAIKVAGMGYATEQISHSISLSTDAECLQSSMKMALREADTDSVDAIVMHAPGTVKGDKSELNAIKKVFSKLPLLTTNKWLIGHTFGASGAMSLEMAVMMLRHNQFIPNPFYKNESLPDRLNTVMVNAVGFGGNAISVILKK